MIVASGRTLSIGRNAATTCSTPMMLVSTIARAVETSQASEVMSSVRDMPALAISMLSSG